MKTNFKIGKIEAIFAICIIMVNRIILNLPYAIINNTGIGSLVNLIYLGIICLLFILILNKLFEKFPNSDIIDLSEYLGGKLLKLIVAILFIVFLLVTLFMTLTDFSNLLQIIYFNNSPAIFILLFFILAILISNLIGFRAIIKTVCLIVPFSIISILLSFLGVFEQFSISKLTPILGDGVYSIFVSGLSNIFAFSIMNFFFFLKPLLKNSYDFPKITIISFLISWVLLFLTIISLLCVFPITVNSSTINFLYLLARKISLGDFLQKIDALFILLWILSIFNYLSVITFILNSIFKKITHAVDGSMFTYFICSILLGASLYPFNISEIKFVQSTIYKYSVLVLLFGVSFSILLLSYWKFKRKKRRKNEK